MCRVFWGQHHEALLPFVSLGLYFLWTEVFPTTSCGFQASGVAEGSVKDVLCLLFWLWAVEDGAEGRLGNAGRMGSGDPPSILHNTSAACFIFNPVYTSCLHFCSFFFFPLWKRCVWFCPCERWFPDRFFFRSNLHDLQLWRGFQSREPQYSFSWRKSSFLCHHLHQKPWRSLSQKGLFLCLRYSLVFGEYCLPIFPSPGFGRALSVSREISRLLCWNSVEARDE